MPASDPRSSVHGYVAKPPANPDITRLRQERIAPWQHAQQVPDALEIALRRRARQQALALIVASSLVSILALYGIWTLLRRVI